MDLSVFLDPLLPLWLVIALAVVLALPVLFGIARGLRGAWVRFAAAAALVLALLNPVVLREERDPVRSVVALAVDRSDSQSLDGRGAQVDEAVAQVKAVVAGLPQFELREVDVTSSGADSAAGGDVSTPIFSRLATALQDVAPDRLAGTIVVTDGQVHDVPETAETTAPVHTLLTGTEQDRDRRLAIRKAPRFGIVGETQEVVFEVVDRNIPGNRPVPVRVLIDGEQVAEGTARPGVEATLTFEVPHGGRVVIELSADVAEGEITDVNNRAYAVLEGIRENLRVLLVSGEPHAGERTWRNLLKSDASVDLVHFTILRPPEKQDGTPINELSLIAFPTRELFIEKIDEFDLIIFDRYQSRGVLPVLYFDNIARYVEEGGAVLVAAGPEYADIGSIYQTPLAPVLPVAPSGRSIEEPYRARVSDEGERHPVTRDLPGANRKRDGDVESEPSWSRWFRLVDGEAARGDVVMQGAEGKPLLVLDRPGKGRVAMLMSDHVWLWARGFEGGGPHSDLLRRLGHWLMREPELDEEALTAFSRGDVLTVERQTMEDEPGPLTLLTPTGERLTLQFERVAPGRWRVEHRAETLGLYRAANGDLTALAHVGAANPREFTDVVSTPDLLQPVAEATGGAIDRLLSAPGASVDVPRIIAVRTGAATSGNGWIGLRQTDATVLRGVDRLPLFAGFLGLALLLGAVAATWYREGR